MPQDRLEQKLRQLGLSHYPQSNTRRLTFRVYFPRPPYGPVEYLAAKQGDGLNFVGQLLGHGGCTLKKIQTDSGARVEVHDGKGNLNGTHPSYTDPSLHAVVFAETREKLTRAAKMIAEVLQPVDAAFERFDVTPGGSVVLKPVIPRKVRSPQSEASSRSRGVWCGASSPSSENDSCLVRDIDSAYVQPSHHPVHVQNDVVHCPWKRVSSLESSEKSETTSFHVKPSQNKPSEKENALDGLKEWKTWGSGNSDCYSQFTTLTQNFVSQYAHRPPREIPAIERPSYFEPFHPSSVWNPVASHINAANLNGSSCAQFHPSPSVEIPHRLGMWGKDKSTPEMEAFLLPNVYDDLIGHTVSPATGAFPAVKESRLTSAYHISVEPEQTKNSKAIHQRIVLPHDL